jgi:hypothetical protein
VDEKNVEKVEVYRQMETYEKELEEKRRIEAEVNHL